MNGQSGHPDRLNYLHDRYAYNPSGAQAPGQPPFNQAPGPGPGQGQGPIPGPENGHGQPAPGYGQQPPAGGYNGYMPQPHGQFQNAYMNGGGQQPAAGGYNPYMMHGPNGMPGMPQQPAAGGYGGGFGYGTGQPASAGFGAPPGYMGMPQMPSLEATTVRALQRIFPDVKIQTLETAARVHGSVEMAANWLRDMRMKGALGGGPGSMNSHPGGFPQSKPRSTMSIREKFASRTGAGAGAGARAMGPLVSQGKKKLQRKYDDSDYSGSDGSDNEVVFDTHSQYEFELRVLNFLNSGTRDAIIDVSGCTDEMVDAVLARRPYASLAQIQKVDVASAAKPIPGEKRKRGATKKPAGSRIVDASLSTLRGYEAVDSLIQECAKLGKDVSQGIQAWGVDTKGAESELEIVEVEGQEAGGGYFKDQPELLAPDIVLKNYQQVGVNWLSLLYNRRLSCILADEMGLGKTCQVISFFAHLKEIGKRGPHLVVCPASTLENWLRELNRFCPNLTVEPYYGSQDERVDIRENILSQGSNFDVMVTTYNLATSSKQDSGFLKSMRFNVCVYDEGHLLKNSQSERYNKLMKIPANFRVLLTGTPLQNNLRELVSLLSFILPSLFENNKEDLLEVFKFKAKTHGDENENRQQLLSEQRIIKAKTMLTPFVLRRRKDQVLQMLPAKEHEIVYCQMEERQRALYKRELTRNKMGLQSANEEVKADKNAGKSNTRKGRQATLAVDNVLMQLRKAALHPLLFRLHYTDQKLKKMTRDIMQEETYKDANADFIFEDMQYMNDFELNRLCKTFPVSLGRYILDDSVYSDSGKVQELKKLLVPMKAQGDRILIFSQFTQVLDILQIVLDQMDIKFLRLDGQTPVEDRQDMIDKFYEDDSITVFMLSTKAGGFGINLAVANVVIIFDLSFNPHDDKQAEDRAHRVGQTRSVRVIRMVMKDSIEESIMKLANTKLALDQHISEEADGVDAESEALVADMVLEGAPTRDVSETPNNVLPSESEISMPSGPADGRGAAHLSFGSHAQPVPQRSAAPKTSAAPLYTMKRGRPRKEVVLSDDDISDDDMDVADDDDDDDDDMMGGRRRRRAAAASAPATRRSSRRAAAAASESLKYQPSYNLESESDVASASEEGDDEEDNEMIVTLHYSPTSANSNGVDHANGASLEAELESEPKAEHKPDVDAQVKLDTDAEPPTEAAEVTVAKAEPETAQPEADAGGEAEAEAQAEAEVDAKPVAKPAAKTEAEPTPEFEPEPTPEYESEPEPELDFSDEEASSDYVESD